MAWWNIKTAPDRKPTDAPQQPEVIYLSSGSAVAIIKYGDAVNAQSAMTHPIVYRALNKIAESAQQMAWFVEEDPNAAPDDRKNKATVIKQLQTLLNSPGSDMTAEMFRYWMALNYATYGRVPIKVSFSALDPERPNGLFPLRADQTFAVFNSRAVPTAYEYGTGQQKETYVSRTAWRPGTPKGFVDQIWKPGLKGHQTRTESNTPLAAIGLPAQVIRSLLLRAIQTAEGHPNVRYLVTCDRALTSNQKDALRQHLNDDHGPEGPDAGKVPILQNAGTITIHTLDNDLSDIHSKMPSDDMARLIFGAFGIPIALAGMGAADGAKFAGNYIESRLAFWQDTIIPGYISPLFHGLTRMICPPGVRISPDLDSIPALMAGRISSMKEVAAVPFLTTTEKRELFGFGPNPALPESTVATPVAPGEPKPGTEPTGEDK